MNNQMKCNGESDELIITFFLYRIWESDNYASWDNVSIDDERLWNVMLKNPADFSEFIQYLVNDTSINVSIVDLGKILKVLHLSTFGINISLVGSNHQLTFNRGNSNIKYLSTDYQFNNNEFYIEFYDDNDNMIIGDYIYLAQNSISDEYTYVISNSGWNRILDIQTLGYYVKITAYSNRFYTENGVTISARTGPYITYERFIKPTNYNITLTNSRYYEKTETIPAGGSFVFNVTDNLGGYRLFQTFGYLDSIIYLYDSLGNPLATNDNFGFSNNGLIYYNISANTTYIINVINNSQVNGLIKLTIIPCTGDLVNNSSTIESVSDIYYHNSNNTYSTYVPQNESIVIRWKPAITGYYCLVLMSNFDSYLYVIDPDSPNLLIEDEDFNDNFVYDEDHDLYDEDSALYGHYYSDQTYLIVISKYNLQDVGSNISIRFDFFFAG